jgi:hypothetical protein
MSFSLLCLFLGPQESDNGDLKSRCQLLASHVFPYSRADAMVGFALAIDNLNDHMQLLVDEGRVDKVFLNDGMSWFFGAMHSSLNYRLGE